MDLSGFGRVHSAVRGEGDTVVRNILKTCEEMLRDRGYTHVTTARDLAKAMEQSHPIVVASGGGKPDNTSVFLHTDERVGIKAARQIIDRTQGQIIVISLEGATPFTKRECVAERVQFINARSLYVNITKHRLQPQFSLCSEFSEEKNNLPKLLDTDPVVVYYNWPVGSVVRIERHFGGSEAMVYFRTVVSTT